MPDLGKEPEGAFNRRAALLVPIGAVLLIILAWSQILDRLTLAYLDDALLGSGAIYATARSINALISVLQGTEIDVVFVSFTVGEILDPVNDLIERFSSLLLLALGSLALQQLLITIASHPIINTLLTVLALAAMLIWLRGGAAQRRLVARGLLLLGIARLILPLVALVGQGVDAAFLAEAERRHFDTVRAFQSELEQAGREAGIGAETGVEGDELEARLGRINATRLEVQSTLDALRAEFAKARAALDALPQAPLWKPWEADSPEVEEARARLAAIEGKLREQRGVAANLSQEAETIQEQLACLERRREGRECSLTAGAMQFVRKADIRPQLLAISERVEDFAAALIRLLTSLIFRTVLLPIATLWLSVRLTQAMARRLGL